MRLRVSVEAPSSEAREMAAGWVLGHLTALVYRMEADRGLFARPSVDEFRASFQECSHRPVRGGALPRDRPALIRESFKPAYSLVLPSSLLCRRS